MLLETNIEEDIIKNETNELTEEELFSKMMEVLNQECARYNFKCEERFGIIYITTKFDGWCFQPYDEIRPVRLMHRNRIGSEFEWHTQFVEVISYVGLVKYIYEHEQAKFYPKYIIPTVVKEKKRKKKSRSARKREMMPIC